MQHLSPFLPAAALALALLTGCSDPTAGTGQAQNSSAQNSSAQTAQPTQEQVSQAAAQPAQASGAVTGEPVTLRVGATPVPAGELLEFVKPKLAQEGINLEVVEFTDYVTPNTALAEGSLDTNLFQHQPYLDAFQKDKPLDIVAVRGIYLPPLSLYSNKVKSLDELKDGATIALPNDPSNEARALGLLQKGGLLTLKEGAGATAGLADIAENPHGFKFLELEAAQLPRSLADTDASIVNANFAMEAGLKPEDAVLHEDADSPYVNVLATTKSRAQDPSITRLADALTTPEVREWLLQKYSGSIIPAF